MISYIVVKYLHYLGIIILSLGLATEYALIKPKISKVAVPRLDIADKVYALGAVIIFATGLLLVFWVGKPASFYSSNHLFYLKFSLFLIIGGLSIQPTLFIKRLKREHEEMISVTPLTRRLIKAQIIILILIPFLGIAMGFYY